SLNWLIIRQKWQLDDSQAWPPATSAGAYLAAAQPLQDRGRSKPVGHVTHGRLELAQRVAGPAPEPAVGLAHIIAARGKMLLQLVAFRPRKHAFVPRPSLHEGLTAAQPVGEMAEGERLGFDPAV